MPPIIKISENLFQEESRFGADFSLIMGHKPPSITPEMFEKKLSLNGGIDMEKLGLFDSSSPNYTTFYPDVKAEDLTPNEADFIYPVFRMLSMTTVNADSLPIDFGKPGVLKSAMGLMLGVTINADHETALGNAMGSVSEVFWQNTYMDPITGNKVPAGINGVFKIDGKSNPRIARGIMMDPPSIHSNSVTIRFMWEKSHPNLTDEEFYMKWGDKDTEGKLIRKIATNIMMVRETSLVALGADPYAQVTNKDGKIMDAGRGKRQYQNMLSANPKQIPEIMGYSLSYKSPKDIYVSDETSFEYKPNNKNADMDLSELLASLGLDPAAFPDADSLKAHIDGMGSQVESLTEEVNNLNTTVSNLTAKLPAEEVLTALAKEGVTEFILSPNFDTNMSISLQYAEHITSLREQATANLKLLEGDSVAPELIAVIQNSDLATLKVLAADYEKKLDAKIPMTCSSCGNHSFSRATAKKHGQEDGKTNLSMAAVKENLRENARKNKNTNFVGKSQQ